MEIFESLQDSVSDTEGLQRFNILPSAGDSSLSTAVFIRVPPKHKFPYHAHSHSEDCFFVLSGGGEVFDLRQSFTAAAVTGVWVPPGVPHGLSANSQGVIEIGFQSPLGPTTEVMDSFVQATLGEIVTASIVPRSVTDSGLPEWSPVFQERKGWRYFDPHYCHLKESQEIKAFAEDYELLVVVASGKVNLHERARSLGAITIIQLKVGESQVLRALEEDALIIGVRVYAA